MSACLYHFDDVESASLLGSRAGSNVVLAVVVGCGEL